VRSIPTIVVYGLREALRRKVFAGVLALYWLANHYVFRDIANVGPPAGIEPRPFAGAFIFGLAMFATLFLGVVLAVFLTLGTVRGDAERGLLQPLIVRPVGRPTLLLARWLGAIAVCTPYVLAVYFASMLITGLTGHWWPDNIVVPAIELAGGVALVAALSLLGSVFLSSTANGIAIFMVFGAGLVAGLLGEIAHALSRGDDRGLDRAVRGPLPGRAERDHRQHDRADRLPAPARPLRRREHGRPGRSPLGLRVPCDHRRRGGLRVLAQGPLTHQELFRRLRAKATRSFLDCDRSRASCFMASRFSSRCSAR
jgi:hypothetical protein